MNLEIDEIRAFLAVADKLNFKAAAQTLFISQPALSRRIDKLETSLQCRLLERTTRRVGLTESGRQFLPHAQAVMDELAQAALGMAHRAAQRQEQLTLACVPSVANHLLPQVLVEFAKTHAAVRVKIIDESAQDVLDAVVSGVADFGVNFIGTQEADIEFKTIYSEHYVLILSRQHPLAARQTIAWGELAQERLVSVSQSSGNRMLIENALANVAIRPTIQYEINHVAGALGLVAAGLGVAVLPALALTPALHPGLTSVALQEPLITRSLGLISRKGSQLAPAAQVFVALLQAALAQRQPAGDGPNR